MSQTKNYIKGLFMKSREGNFGTEFEIDFTDEAIEHLKTLPKNDKGYRRLKINAQKNDATKFSVYENTYVPKGEGTGLPF